MSTMAAAVSMEIPAAIEKNETMEEMSRMVGGRFEGTLQHGSIIKQIAKPCLLQKLS